MASPCSNDPNEVLEKIVSIKNNADKFDTFVNGTSAQSVQLGNGAATPTLRNAAGIIFGGVDNAGKFDKFVNGTDTQTVQLGSGSPTPSIRNVVRQVKADGEWIKRFIADAPEGDISLNNVTALGSISSRTLTERFSDIVNVKDFGAIGDGVANDTIAIRNAIAAADGRIIFFPAGVYLTDQIGINYEAHPQQNEYPFRFIGSGIDSTIIKCRTLTHNIFFLNGVKGFSVESMTIDANQDGNSDAGGSCIYGIDCCDFHAKNLYLKNFRQCGIICYPTYSDGIFCKNYTIENVIFDGSLFYNKQFTNDYNSGMICTSVENGFAINCRAIKCTRFGLEWKGYRSDNANSSGTSINCWFVGCSTDRCGDAFSFGGEDAAGTLVDEWRNANSGCIACVAEDSLHGNFTTGYGYNILFDDCTYVGNPNSEIPSENRNVYGTVANFQYSKGCNFSGTAVQSAIYLTTFAESVNCNADFKNAQPNLTAFSDTNGILVRRNLSTNSCCSVRVKSAEATANDFAVPSWGAAFATSYGVALYIQASNGTFNYARQDLPLYSIDQNTGIRQLNGNIYPTGSTTSLGTSNAKWGEIYTNELNADTIVVSTATGAMRRDNDNSNLLLSGGSSFVYVDKKGARLLLSGADSSGAGDFELFAMSSSGVKVLTGGTDGTLQWDGQDIQISSDERLKTALSAVPDAVLDAWGNVQWGQFKFLEAVSSKGEENSRLHLGLIAQHVKNVFEARGLDACEYGILCHEKREADGEEPAVDLWMVRYGEAQAMEAAYQRRRADLAESRIAVTEERIAALEARLNEISVNGPAPSDAE